MALNKCQANVEIMKKQVSDLEDEKEAVRRYIEDTNRSGLDQIELQMLMKWLTRAEYLITAAHKFVDDVEKNEKQKCFFGLCLNPQSHNQLSKQAERSSKDIVELVQEARRFNIPLSYYLKNSVAHGFENFDSRSDLFKEILETLQIGSVNKIGVHGLPGVGKTMLVREVKRKAEQEKLFDEVVIATVGRNPDFPRIQVEIASGLGLDSVSNELTAQKQGASYQIRARLREKEVLVILDDIWAPGIDLEKLGIPLGVGQKQHGQEKNEDNLSCKILLTSRHSNVLLDQMGVEKNFEIGPLTEKEAWGLFTKIAEFKKIAVDPAESRSLWFYASEIVKECERLPISIAILANGLKSRTLVDWNAALRKLQSPSQANLLEIPKGLRLAVELSYGGLESKKLQQMFLLCSLMGHNATIKDLLKYGMGLGLFPEVKSMEEARNQALTLVSKLKDTFLLLDGGSNVQFDMHDFVRVVAIPTASQDHGVLASRDEDAPIVWQDNKAIMEKLKWIYSSNFNASGYQLPGELNCPQLTFFHLSNKDPSLAVPPNLFRETEGLKVLGLIKLHLLSIPSSISFPINLHTLCLDQSGLGSVDIRSILGELKNLQVLSLVGCDIQKLPEEVGKLIRLKFLDLSDCTKLKVIPPGILSSLSRLEELYLGNSFAQWDYNAEQQNRRNASFVELTELKNLTTLEVSVCDIQMFPKVLFFTELKRYKIFIGDVWNFWGSSFENPKILKLKLDARIHFDYSVRELLKKTDELHLEVLNGVYDMVHEFDDDGFQQLKCLHVKNYPEIQYLFIDSKKGIGGKIFPNLEVFLLHNSIKLEKIFHGQFVQTSFNNLRIMYVERCSQLKNLFSFFIAKQLLRLQEITVADCSNIVEIVDDEGEGSTDVSTKGTNVLKLAELQCLRLQHLPEFISFSHEDDTSSGFTSLFNKKVAFPNLKRITISHLENSRMLWQELSKNSFCNLKSLRVTSCQNLSAIFSSNNDMLTVHLKSLEKLEIIDCSSLNEIEILSSIRILMLDSLDNLTCIFSQDSTSVLQTLKVWRCDSLTCLSTSKIVSFSNLTTLNVQGCHRMTILVSSKVAQSLVQLVRMTVRECKNLTKIIGSDSLGREDSVINFSKLRFLKLECLSRLQSFYSNKFKLEFSSLEMVFVDQCPKLKIFSEGHVNTPMLQRVELTEGEDKWYWYGDLNTTIKRMCTGKVGFVGLKDLILQDFPELMNIWHVRSPQEILDFRQLECLDFYDCNNFRSLLTPSMVMCLVQLRSIIIKSCGMLEQVIMKDREESKMIFPQLWLINLESCSDLTTFYAGSYGLEIPALANIIVNDCPKMLTFTACIPSKETSQYFFSSKVALRRLQQLTIKSMGSLNKIWDEQHDADSWCQLNTVIVDTCEKLLNIFSFSMRERLQKLEKLEIHNCNSLWEIFEYQGLGSSESQAQIITQPTLVETITKFVFPKLTHLNLFKLTKLNCFWRQIHTIEWPSLKKLEVYGCHQVQIFASELPSFRERNGNNQLKIGNESPLFWVSKATFPVLKELKLKENEFMKEIWRGQNPGDYLPKLEKLEICNCNLLEEIFECQKLSVTTQATLMETATKFVFPKLTHLDLYKLPKLKCFCRQMHTTEWPSLKKLKVYGCDLQIFATESPSLQGTKESNQLEIEIPATESPSLRGTKESNQLEIETQCPLFWVSEATFPNLKELKLEENKFMKDIWRGQNPGSYFPKLKVLELENLYEQSFAAIPPLFVQSLPDLEKLVVKNTFFNEIFPCQRLGTEADAPRQLTELMLFGNLQTLEVFQCHRLRNLVGYSTTKSLVQLRTMTIINCNMIEEILVCEGDDVKNDIFFMELKHLHLKDLPILKGFCWGKCNFQFPSLEDVIVSNCPKLQTFTEGEASTAKLQKVKFEVNKERWERDLNTTIQVYWENEKASIHLNLFLFQCLIYSS